MVKESTGRDDAGELLQTPLHAFHLRNEAKMVPYAGYEMPIQYPTGIIKEHRQVRSGVGLFDVSHMLQVHLKGEDAGSLLARACPMVAEDLPLLRSRYSMLLNEDAGVIDDLIATRLSEDCIQIVSNASRRDAVLRHLGQLAEEFSCLVEPQSWGLVAVQGPGAADLLSEFKLDTAEMTYLECRDSPAARIVRCGYTGESGFEIAMPANMINDFADALVSAGAIPIGLGARDSLRLEAGFCLYGQELTESISPVEAGLSWAITRKAREEGRFVGANPLASRPVTKRLVGLRPQGQAPVRAGAELLHDGKPVGAVTSGGYGPSVEAPVAMGYIAPVLAEPGIAVDAQVRNRYIACEVVALPFVRHRYRD